MGFDENCDLIRRRLVRAVRTLSAEREKREIIKVANADKVHVTKDKTSEICPPPFLGGKGVALCVSRESKCYP